MITSISLKNFKSYASAKLPFAPLTFLIGANASGKSNAIEAMRLLVELAKGQRLDDIEGTIQGGDAFIRGQVQDLFRDPKELFEIGCEFDNVDDDWNSLAIGMGTVADRLTIQKECITKPEESVPLYEIASEPTEHSDEIGVAYNNFDKGPNKPRIPCSNRQAVFFQLESPGRFGEKHQRSQEIIPLVAKQIRNALRDIVFLDPQPTAMRGYSFSKDNDMKEDGSNVSSVALKIRESGNKSQLLEFIRSLPEQDIADVNFIQTDRGDVMIRLAESFGGETRLIDAPLLSDGTLRVLAVAATLLTASSGSLVVIEEIDNGVHPSRAETLVKQIQQVSQERNLRVLVTTHNPALLDSLPDIALGDVLCCYRDVDDGDSKIARLGDIDRYPDLVAQGSLGELVTNQILDRFLKDKTTAEQRQQNSLQWLQQFKEGTDT